MADYIRRRKVEFELCGGNLPEKYKAFVRRVLNDKNLVPAADVAPVVFARWEEADWREYDAQSCETIRYPKVAIVCTNCRCAFKKDALWSRNYCPNCGAKMDGGNDHVSD